PPAKLTKKQKAALKPKAKPSRSKDAKASAEAKSQRLKERERLEREREEDEEPPVTIKQTYVTKRQGPIARLVSKGLHPSKCSDEYRDALIHALLNVDTAPKGLRNLGNTCFMNGALQCLSHLTGVRQCLADALKRGVPGPAVRGTLQAQWIEFLAGMTSAGEAGVDTSPDIKAMYRKATSRLPFFGDYAQHDAHAFTTMLIDALDEDTKKVTGKEGEVNGGPALPHSNAFKWKCVQCTTCLVCGTDYYSRQPCSGLSLEMKSTVPADLAGALTGDLGKRASKRLRSWLLPTGDDAESEAESESESVSTDEDDVPPVTVKGRRLGGVAQSRSRSFFRNSKSKAPRSLELLLAHSMLPTIVSKGYK
ncbi:hypothetical protein KIPB_009198, partial [Kipferlia bialata]